MSMSPDARATAFVPAPIARVQAEKSPAAHAEGYAAGWAAGARAAAEAGAAERSRERAENEQREAQRDQELRDTVAALTAAIDHWRSLAAPVLADAEQTLHQAALELTEAVLTREVRPGPDSAVALLAKALTLPHDTQPTVLRLSSQDLPHVQQLIDSGSAVLPAGLSLVADPNLGPGDSITEHATGILDARIGQALERARAALGEES